MTLHSMLVCLLFITTATPPAAWGWSSGPETGGSTQGYLSTEHPVVTGHHLVEKVWNVVSAETKLIDSLINKFDMFDK